MHERPPSWKSRVKGRDWYDFAFLVRKKIPLLLPHLEARLRQKGFYKEKGPLDEDRCINMIDQRIESVDFDAVKADVITFILRPLSGNKKVFKLSDLCELCERHRKICKLCAL